MQTPPSLHPCSVLVDGDQTIGHYRILERLGAGGMGEVYLAEDSKLCRNVALKILPPERCDSSESCRRFEREARALAALNHPNIVTLYSLEEWRGARFITMEWVDGRTLREVLKSSGPLPVADLIDIAVQTAEGLAEAHAQQLIHRDLKPQNIMVTASGRVKILDFGLAKGLESLCVVESASDAETLSPELTLEGALIGTVSYMSPEQMLGKALDSRSDVFSLGAVLYEMATARQAFPGGMGISTLAQILESEPRPLAELRPELPAEFDRIVRRCLQKERSRRYSDTRSLTQDLKALQQGHEEHEKRGPALASVGARLLLVEDEPALARGLADNFRDEGYEVRTVGHGDEALPAAAAFRPDLLVLDIMLPGRSGLDILRDLRARGDGLPVLILTAKGDLVDRVVGLELGADDYMTKPFAARELLARVRALLRRRGRRDSAEQISGCRKTLTAVDIPLTNLLLSSPILFPRAFVTEAPRIKEAHIMTEKHSQRSSGSRQAGTAFMIAALTITLSTAIAVVAGPLARLAWAEAQRNFAALMTQAKLQADLGNHREAAEAFASIAGDVTAPAALRSEAMVRRGLALNAAGDVRASKEVFKQAAAGSSADPRALRFLTYAVARTVPGKIWPGFRATFEDLLKNAEVVSFDELAMGVTTAKRVHLKKDELELRAVWRPYPPSGDGAQRSYRAEIAAYELDKMLGLDMVPPTVERTIEGRTGSIQLWINGCRSYKDVQGKTPATSDWNHQVFRVNLFDALIGNTLRNATALLVDPDSEIVLVDHSGSFSSETELRNPPSQFDRRLLARLRALREDELQIRLKGVLGTEDIGNVLKRRDALLAHIAKLVAEKGETAVLF